MPHAFLLELAPLQDPPSFIPFSLHAHGLFFTLLAKVDQNLAARVHEAKRKPFTLTPLPNKHILRLRVTTLDDALFAPLLRVLLEEAPRGLSLGDKPYALTRVIATPEGDRLAGKTTWEELAQAVSRQQLTLHFLTPTVFTSSKPGGRTRYVPFPDPRLILTSLLTVWQAYSPFVYSEEEAATLREVFELDVELAGFRNLHYHRIQAGKSAYPGFTGEVHLRLFSEDRQTQKAFGRLEAFAFYSGVGAKTPYGMGMTFQVGYF